MGLFGISRREAWEQLCKEINADYVRLGFWAGDRVELIYRNWKIILDTYTVSTGKSSVTYTRVRAPFINKTGINFRIYKKGLFSNLAISLGSKIIKTENFQLDDGYMIKGNDESRIQSLLANEAVADLICSQAKIDLRVKDDEGLFGKSFAANEDELYFQAGGVIKDTAILKGILNLFIELLKAMEEMNIIGEDIPTVVL